MMEFALASAGDAFKERRRFSADTDTLWGSYGQTVDDWELTSNCALAPEAILSCRLLRT